VQKRDSLFSEGKYKQNLALTIQARTVFQKTADDYFRPGWSSTLLVFNPSKKTTKNRFF